MTLNMKSVDVLQSCTSTRKLNHRSGPQWNPMNLTLFSSPPPLSFTKSQKKKRVIFCFVISHLSLYYANRPDFVKSYNWISPWWRGHIQFEPMQGMQRGIRFRQSTMRMILDFNVNFSSLLMTYTEKPLIHSTFSTNIFYCYLWDLILKNNDD